LTDASRQVQVAYVDTSAFVKLAVEEPESTGLRSFLGTWAVRASSALLRTESIRATRRHGADAVAAARRELRSVTLVALTDELLDAAALLDPVSIRSLDAIHLATARSLGADVGVVVTYDDRMADAARGLGLEVASPSEPPDDTGSSG